MVYWVDSTKPPERRFTEVAREPVGDGQTEFVIEWEPTVPQLQTREDQDGNEVLPWLHVFYVPNIPFAEKASTSSSAPTPRSRSARGWGGPPMRRFEWAHRSDRSDSPAPSTIRGGLGSAGRSKMVIGVPSFGVRAEGSSI